MRHKAHGLGPHTELNVNLVAAKFIHQPDKRAVDSKPGLTPNGTHFEPQRASVRAGRLVITRESGPHASALRLIIYKVSAIKRWTNVCIFLSAGF